MEWELDAHRIALMPKVPSNSTFGPYSSTWQALEKRSLRLEILVDMYHPVLEEECCNGEDKKSSQ